MPPLLILTAAAVTGILVSRWSEFTFFFWWIFLFISLGSACFPKLKLFSVLFFFLCLYAIRFQVVWREKMRDPLKNMDHYKIILKLQPISDPFFKGKTFRFTAEVLGIRSQAKWIPVQASVSVYSLEKVSEQEGVEAVGTLSPVKFLYFQEQGIHHSFFAWKVLRMEKNKGGFPLFFLKVRKALEQWILFSLPPPYSQISLGIFLGNHALIPPDILRDFQVTGTYHVLVASGLKTAFVAGAAWFVFSETGFYPQIFLSMISVLFYVFVVGAEPPILRAGIMTLFGFFGILIGRKKDSLNIFLLTALILLFADPVWLFEVGFQLSFSAVLGILTMCDKIQRKLKFLPSWISASISVSLSSMLPILVPVAYYFHYVSYAALFANLLVVPLTLVSMIMGMISFLLGFLWKPFGLAFSFWNQLVLEVMLRVIRFFAHLPFAYQNLAPPGFLTGFLFYSFLFGFWLWLTEHPYGKWVMGISLIYLFIWLI